MAGEAYHKSCCWMRWQEAGEGRAHHGVATKDHSCSSSVGRDGRIVSLYWKVYAITRAERNISEALFPAHGQSDVKHQSVFDHKRTTTQSATEGGNSARRPTATGSCAMWSGIGCGAGPSLVNAPSAGHEQSLSGQVHRLIDGSFLPTEPSGARVCGRRCARRGFGDGLSGD